MQTQVFAYILFHRAAVLCRYSSLEQTKPLESTLHISCVYKKKLRSVKVSAYMYATDIWQPLDVLIHT